MERKKIHTNQLRLSPVKHSTLTEEQRARCFRVYDVLGEHTGCVREKWAEGFELDRHPEQEILIWEKLVQDYQKRLMLYNTPAKRRKLYANLLARSTQANPITVRAAQDDLN